MADKRPINAAEGTIPASWPDAPPDALPFVPAHRELPCPVPPVPAAVPSIWGSGPPTAWLGARVPSVQPPVHDESALTRSQSVAPATVSTSESLDLVWWDPRSLERLGSFGHRTPPGTGLRWSDRPSAPTTVGDAYATVVRALTSDASVPLRDIVVGGCSGASESPGRPSLVVVAGEFELMLSVKEALRRQVQMLDLSGPLDKREDDVRQLVRAVTGSDPEAASDIILYARDRLEEVLRARSCDVAASNLAVERAVVESRAYQSRLLLGGLHYCAALRDGAEFARCYIPVEARPDLPLLRSFAARLVAEVRPRQEPPAHPGRPDAPDQRDWALKIIAIGRPLRATR